MSLFGVIRKVGAFLLMTVSLPSRLHMFVKCMASAFFMLNDFVNICNSVCGMLRGNMNNQRALFRILEVSR